MWNSLSGVICGAVAGVIAGSLVEEFGLPWGLQEGVRQKFAYDVEHRVEKAEAREEERRIALEDAEHDRIAALGRDHKMEKAMVVAHEREKVQKALMNEIEEKLTAGVQRHDTVQAVEERYGLRASIMRALGDKYVPHVDQSRAPSKEKDASRVASKVAIADVRSASKEADGKRERSKSPTRLPQLEDGRTGSKTSADGRTDSKTSAPLALEDYAKSLSRKGSKEGVASYGSEGQVLRASAEGGAAANVEARKVSKVSHRQLREEAASLEKIRSASKELALRSGSKELALRSGSKELAVAVPAAAPHSLASFL